ncbi:alpha/beta hydrolase [Nodularia spumigena]|uniref:Alpha/beta hydrolase n=1 Tax=Nodularia spumigena UHCC 0060 TaxID=3110300 RepID=A0ABU5USU4_NODSP|nr:alpha/beta hydrolase [Nodularia spumigena]MEA5526663.1 alpha/beta hydrolase [Nodularia spumigena UHCC 0143]MEA5608140.1 alpha/beta hydrolase [Nodularia spumigena UHCC 0060]MEA5612738.1 alpha/beta hydrolase [Nodularia spumigena UHCC 0040]
MNTSQDSARGDQSIKAKDVTKKIDQFCLEKISTDNLHTNVLGYYVSSTAQINVDNEKEETKTKEKLEETEIFLKDIASHLVNCNEDLEIVISIHGYANEEGDAKNSYDKIYNHAKKEYSSKKVVFLGYIWPSEKPFQKKYFINAIHALPILLEFPRLVLFLLGLCISLSISLIFYQGKIWTNLLIHLPAVILALILFSIICSIFSLILLRLSTYFRDSYRATNYGVPDLVELIRWIEHFVLHTGNNSDQNFKEKKIKLIFIGHSMGCFVATNTIRILSDVFDDSAIEGNPGNNIGKVFCLERLVLVAPDIPVETIMPRRANFLRASLRRCKEAYVFCNEGDLALRLLSPIANYFSFPAKNRINGYRLGNITAKRDENYGIINYVTDNKYQNPKPNPDPFNNLQIRSINNQIYRLKDISHINNICQDKKGIVANQFTYFDCTDYVDEKNNEGQNVAEYKEKSTQEVGIVSCAKRSAKTKSALNWYNYISLIFALFGRNKIDTHGGYFTGMFSQKLIYDLAFVGFQEMLNTKPFDKSLDTFSKCCEKKQIKVVLSPMRWDETQGS